MLPLISFSLGLILSLSFSSWLWYLLTRPKQWADFNEKENTFWLRYGLPVNWVRACKEFEQGRGLKALIAFCIIMAGVLTVAAFIILLIGHRHG
jgi:hypothetical protein